MTFSGLNFGNPNNLGNISYSDVSLGSNPFQTDINVNTGYDWGNFWNLGPSPDFGVDIAGLFDLPGLKGVNALAPLPSTTTSGFGDLFKGIFELPSILSLGKGIMDATTAAAAYKTRAADAASQNAAAQQEYWTRYADQVAQNYRDYQYQLETYYRDVDYVQKRRDYEDQLAKQQAEFVGATATQAFKNFERQIADLEGRFYEEEAKETVEIENIRAQLIAAAGKAQSRGQVGRSVERLTNQYHQQYLANVSNREVTRNFRIADKVRQGEALDVARQNTTNQAQFYTPQPFSDPIKPLAPLPITAVPPTPVSGPSQTALTIELANIGLEAYENYKSMQPPKPTISEQFK
jgi:hypothetical protein